MKPATPPPSPRRRKRPGPDWLMALAGVLALVGSLKQFVDSDPPELAQATTEKSTTS